MNLKDELISYAGKYCAVQEGDGTIVVTLIPSMHSSSERDAKKYCEMYRCGRPGKITDMGDDFLKVNYFYGYSKRNAIIPFKGLLFEQGSF